MHDQVGAAADLGQGGQRAVLEPASPITEELQQPRQVRRHLHERHREAQAVRVGCRQLVRPRRPDVVETLGPPRPGRGCPIEREAVPHDHAGHPGAGLPKQHSVGVAAPTRHVLAGCGQRREPHRCGNRRRRRRRVPVGDHDDRQPVSSRPSAEVRPTTPAPTTTADRPPDTSSGCHRGRTCRPEPRDRPNG